MMLATTKRKLTTKENIIIILTLPFTILQGLLGGMGSLIYWLIDRHSWNNTIIEERLRRDMYWFWNWVLDESDEETRKWLNQKSEEWRKKGGF